MASDDFQYSEEVAHALSNRLPIVALESTIISHGMPYPQNVQTARAVEDIIRHQNVVPATIAILHGKVHIGLDEAALETLGKAGRSCMKCSRKDLPMAMAQKRHGATTVAATMYLAHCAGLKVFVTGGIGGVHRDVGETWDVSADLIELGRTPITVVCAGAKSILDIPKTLEFLETQGVPVVVYNSQYFPAFFSPSSGIEVAHVVHAPGDCAQLIAYSEKLGLQNGILVAVPLQQAEHNNKIEGIIEQAVEEAKQQNIRGAAITPFLLARVNELSAGSSLEMNILLIKQNAEFGAQIAKAYYSTHRVVCIGAALQQINATGSQLDGGLGGVAQIAAEIASPLVSAELISVMGNDYFGKSMTAELKACGVLLSHMLTTKGSSDARHILDADSERIYLSQIEKLRIVPKTLQVMKYANLVLLDPHVDETIWNTLGDCTGEIALHWAQYVDMVQSGKSDLFGRVKILSISGHFLQRHVAEQDPENACKALLERYPNLSLVIAYWPDGSAVCATPEEVVKGTGKGSHEETTGMVLQKYLLKTRLANWLI